jgi:hypothetical protein
MTVTPERRRIAQKLGQDKPPLWTRLNPATRLARQAQLHQKGELGVIILVNACRRWS